jgi:hypothetical protein
MHLRRALNFLYCLPDFWCHLPFTPCAQLLLHPPLVHAILAIAFAINLSFWLPTEGNHFIYFWRKLLRKSFGYFFVLNWLAFPWILSKDQSCKEVWLTVNSKNFSNTNAPSQQINSMHTVNLRFKKSLIKIYSVSFVITHGSKRYIGLTSASKTWQCTMIWLLVGLTLKSNTFILHNSNYIFFAPIPKIQKYNVFQILTFFRWDWRLNHF